MFTVLYIATGLNTKQKDFQILRCKDLRSNLTRVSKLKHLFKVIKYRHSSQIMYVTPWVMITASKPDTIYTYM